MIKIRKNKKIIIISMIAVGVVIFLCLGEVLLNKQIIDIPKGNEISFIEIYYDFTGDISKHHTIEGDKDISELYNVFLSGKKSKIMKSVNDSPSNANGKLIRIVLTDSSNNNITLFAYQGNNGKYYIERPYEGIYEISVQG